MSVSDLVSKCCDAPVTVWTGGEGTQSWGCSGCGCACDARSAEQREHLNQSGSAGAPAGGPLSRMSEADLERGIRHILRDLEKQHRKVLAYHPWNSENSEKGWPDWSFAGPGGAMWRELKRESEDPTPEQQEWLDALVKAGCDAGVWRPSDLLSNRIGRELAALAGIRPGGDR